MLFYVNLQNLEHLFELTFDSADLLLQKVTFTLTQFQSVPQKVFNVHTATELSCNALTLVGVGLGQEVCITHVTLSPPRHPECWRWEESGGR